MSNIQCYNCNKFGHYSTNCKLPPTRFSFRAGRGRGRGRYRSFGYNRQFQPMTNFQNEFIQSLMEERYKKEEQEREEKMKKEFGELIKGEIDSLKKNLNISESQPEAAVTPTNEVLIEMMKMQTKLLNKMVDNRKGKRERSRKKRKIKPIKIQVESGDEGSNDESDNLDDDESGLDNKHDDDSDYFEEKPTHDELLDVKIPVYVNTETLAKKGEGYKEFVAKIIKKFNYHWGIGQKNSIKDEVLKQLCTERGISLRMNGKMVNKKMKVKLLAQHSVDVALKKM